MAQTVNDLDSLRELLEASNRPVYAVDGQRRIVFCNAALASWLEIEPDRIVGRLVEYHSEPTSDSTRKGDALPPLSDLCPPPRALAGEPCAATISCYARGGRLAHRHADFVPLHVAAQSSRGAGVLVLLSNRDLSQQELAVDLSVEPTADELHRSIRRFRREQEGYYQIESLLGNSSTMQKLRAQVAAAAVSGANTLIDGRSGTGRGHVARAIHYHTSGPTPAKLVPIDCELVTDDRLRRALEALQNDDGRYRSTLLLENLDRLEAPLQTQLLAVLRHNAFRARVLATRGDSPVDSDLADSEEQIPAAIDPALLDTVSIINIRMPRLLERLDDLPILAQCFLEACNHGTGKQVGSLRADALDQLALYGWPGELDELREVIAAAHRTCKSHEISAADLPSVIYHASQTASRVRKQPQRIVLDELLAKIEREAIVQALAQAGGNKTEAADLLGMTRPRLYRRLVQLGLIADLIDAPESSIPEFIEHPPSDEAP